MRGATPRRSDGSCGLPAPWLGGRFCARLPVRRIRAGGGSAAPLGGLRPLQCLIQSFSVRTAAFSTFGGFTRTCSHPGSAALYISLS